jgi:hypothetical protein
VFTQWFGCALRKYPGQAAHWIFIVVDLLAKAQDLKPRNEPTEENRLRWYELVITAAKVAWDVPKIKAAISTLLGSSATIPEDVKLQVSA